MCHLRSKHPDVHKKVEEEVNKVFPPAKRRRVQEGVLNGVKMSPEALQVHCLRLVTESGLAFKFLDEEAFQDIISPMIDAMPASER